MPWHCTECVAKSLNHWAWLGHFQELWVSGYYLIHHVCLSHPAVSAWEGVTCQGMKCVSAPDSLSRAARRLAGFATA